MTTDDKIKLFITRLTEKADKFYWAKDSNGWCITHEAGFRIRVGSDTIIEVLTDFGETMIPEEDLNRADNQELRTKLVYTVSKLWNDRSELIDRVIKELDKL